MSAADITLWRRPKAGGNGNGTPVLPCDPAALDFTKPILLCLSGIETTTAKQANGFAKRIVGLAGGDKIFDSGAQVITAQYSPISTLAEAHNATDGGAALLDVLGQRIKAFTTDVFPTHDVQKELRPKAEKCADYLINTIFARKDVIPDLNGLDGAARGEALNRCQDALAQITIASYSFGSYITPYLHDRMRQLMKERGFTKKEGMHARNQLQVVSFGDVGIWFRNAQDMEDKTQRAPWDFTSVHVVSVDDIAVQKFAGITPEATGDGLARDRLITFGGGIEENVALLVSRLPKTITGYSELEKFKKSFGAGVDPASPTLVTHERHWTGHAVPDYTGTGQAYPGAEVKPYFSLEGGQWFIPSALATALHHCLESSVNQHSGNHRGDALAMLAPDAQKDTSQTDFSNVPAEQIPLPGNPGYYPYGDRMRKLIEERLHVDRLPPRKQESWAQMLSEGRTLDKDPLCSP